MRIANKTLYDSVKVNLGNLGEELSAANAVVSSGKRILQPSDDPVGSSQVLNLRSVLSGLEQLGRNIGVGRTWLNAAEGAVGQVQDLVADTRALAVQMASDTTGPEQRASAAGTVQNTLDEIVSLANSESGGRYIFGGSRTDAAPFDAEGTYRGDDHPFCVKIGARTTIEVGRNGADTFGTLFDTLKALRDDLAGNNTDGIRASLDELAAHFDQASNTLSDIGSKMNRMEIKEAVLSDLTFANTERLSAIEDADLAGAIMELTEKQLAYQAALASSSKVMQVSLMNYLK